MTPCTTQGALDSMENSIYFIEVVAIPLEGQTWGQYIKISFRSSQTPCATLTNPCFHLSVSLSLPECYRLIISGVMIQALQGPM